MKIIFRSTESLFNRIAFKLIVILAIAACSAANGLSQTSPPQVPDKNKTPGATLKVTKKEICVSGYTKLVRNVPQSLKEKVYAEYGITSRMPREYEIDHLISLELGGSNSIKNLWPQSYLTSPWNAHLKDRLENKLHQLICSNRITLKTAQQEIKTDWIAAYRKYIKDAPDSGDNTFAFRENEPDPARNEEPDPTSTSDIIGNRRSRIYYLPACRGYNRVSDKRQVRFKTETEAESAGYRKAKTCRGQ